MKINRVRLTNFLAFTGDTVEVNFDDGINVFIGANGTGKTTLLKSIYAACEFSKQTTHADKAKKFSDYFSASKSAIKDINQKQNDNDFGLIQVFSGENEFHYRAWDDTLMLSNWFKLGINSVLIPSRDMLSHSNGLIAMSSKYGVPFDYTLIDILINAQVWETKTISDKNRLLLSKIGQVIDGEVIYEDDTFFIQKSNGLKVEFSLEADGLKRFGLLWKLIRNGLLESGSILLWDEPEASINPELIPVLVEVIIELSKQGIQIFLATHDYNLIKYFSIFKKSYTQIAFFNFYKTDSGIACESADDYDLLERNAIIDAEIKLLEDDLKGAL